MKLRELKKGEYFTIKSISQPKESQVYIKGEYDRSLKKYSCIKFDDVNHEVLLKSDKEIYIDFIF